MTLTVLRCIVIDDSAFFSQSIVNTTIDAADDAQDYLDNNAVSLVQTVSVSLFALLVLLFFCCFLHDLSYYDVEIWGMFCHSLVL